MFIVIRLYHYFFIIINVITLLSADVPARRACESKGIELRFRPRQLDHDKLDHGNFTQGSPKVVPPRQLDPRQVV